MKILLVNDDGYTSKGIRGLAQALSLNHEVTVVAPVICNSGKAHAMTFYKDLYLKKIENNGENYDCYSFSATPADCVKIGVELMSSNPPDLIISGINNEPNIGTTIVYSGTAAAAMEGSLLGFKAIAVSGNPEDEDDFDYIIKYFVENLDYYLTLCSTDYALNVNVNNQKIGNVSHKIAPLGVRIYSDYYIVGEANEQGVPYKLVGEPLPVENVPDCDVSWFEKGYATITPLTSDHTSFTALDKIRKMVK